MIPVNYFNASLFLGSLIALGSGIFAYFRNKERLANRAWLRLNIAVAIWSFGYFLMITTSDKTTAWYSNWILHAAAIFIPVLYTHFILALIGKTKQYRRVLYMSYFLAAIFFVINPTIYFVQDVKPKFIFDYVCDAGPLYGYFTAYFFGWVIAINCLLYENIKNRTGIIATQLKYVFFSSMIGFAGGGSVFLLTFNIPFPPYPIILFALYPLVITYAIVRYRFMDVRAVVFRSFIFGLALMLVAILYVLLSSVVSLYFSDLFGKNANIITGLVLGVLVMAGYAPIHKGLEQITRNFLYRKSYNADKLLSKINDSTSSILNINQLLTEVSKTLIEAFHCEKFGVALLKETGENLKILSKEGFEPGVAEFLTGYKNVTDILLKELEKNKGILVIDEMKNRHENGEFQPVSVDLLYELNKNDIALIAPLYVKKRLIGIMVIGTKKSGEPYNNQDINVLNIITGQMAVATENAQLYDQLREFNVTLQQKVDEQTKEIQRAYEVEKRANEELKNLDRVKNQFLMQTQHDLRTPLTTIRGYCDLLVDGNLGKLNKKAVDIIKRVQVTAENKIKDVNNFLDVSQFQLGKKVVSLTPGVELNPILGEIAAELSPGAESKGIYLKLDRSGEKLVVEADREKLKAALFNIIDNSIKYTAKGGVIVVVVTNPKSETPNSILITVKDTGIGIPKEKIKTLFDTAFERGDEAKKMSVTGKGVGLYLSSQIIKAHNGKVRAESDGQGKGSAFYIELPAQV